MARGFVFAALAAANVARGFVDTDQGYPKAGVNVGSGRHVTPAFVTQTYCLAYKHPTLNQWALLQDAVTDASLPGKPGVNPPVDLDSTWGLG